METLHQYHNRPQQEPDGVRRYRNVVAAIENLITQMDAWESQETFATELKLAHRLYRMELSWHIRAGK